MSNYTFLRNLIEFADVPANFHVEVSDDKETMKLVISKGKNNYVLEGIPTEGDEKDKVIISAFFAEAAYGIAQ